MPRSSRNAVIPATRQDPTEVCLLASQLSLAAHEAGRLPPTVTASLAELDRALLSLADALDDSKPPVEVTADLLRRSWGGMETWLLGWTQTPGLPESEAAAIIHRLLFSGGLATTAQSVEVALAEGEARFDHIESSHLGEVIGRLGGASLLSNLERLFDELGRAVERTPANVLKRCEAAQAAIVHHTGRINAFSRLGGSQRIVDQLLAPIRKRELMGRETSRLPIISDRRPEEPVPGKKRSQTTELDVLDVEVISETSPARSTVKPPPIPTEGARGRAPAAQPASAKPRRKTTRSHAIIRDGKKGTTAKHGTISPDKKDRS